MHALNFPLPALLMKRRNPPPIDSSQIHAPALSTKMNPSNDEVEMEFFPFVRVYKSGRMERILESEFLPAGLDSETGVVSRDIEIDSDTGVTARLYLPSNTPPGKKLPILVYYHGGGFCIETAFSPTYHPYLNSLVSKAHIVAVSVDYRRLPDHPLPAAYNDSWAALSWVASKSDVWLNEHGDFERVFLAGDSAGANIVHQMAMRASTTDLPNKVKLHGIALIHPYFWGSQAVGSEKRERESDEKMEGMWRFVCPSTSGVDDPAINPTCEGAPSLAGLACKKVLVSVAEMDILRERGRAYLEKLKESGWRGEVEFVERVGENHVFHLRDPNCDKAADEMARMVALLNNGE